MAPDEPVRPDLNEEGSALSPPGDLPLPPDLQRSAPSFLSGYDLGSVALDEQRRLLSLARLPPWPMQDESRPAGEPGGLPPPAFGHGWGPYLDAILGHGLAPGEMLALGASSAGAGKTAFLMQLCDGLALRNVHVLRGEAGWGPMLTPVLVASEMSLRALSWRSLARWTGHPAYVFRAGRSLLEAQGIRGREAEAAWASVRVALGPHSAFRASREWLRLLDGRESGQLAGQGAAIFVEHLRSMVELWREELSHTYPNRPIVPVVVIDPLQRYQAGDDDIRDLNALARELCAATLAGDWISLLTSDTNKAAARGDKGDSGRSDAEEGAGVFRGSYGLIHEVSSALYLRRPPKIEPSADEEREGRRYVEAVMVKNRWGASSPPWPRFQWYGATGRFWPMTREGIESHDVRVLRETEGRKSAPGEPSREALRKGSPPVSNPYEDDA